MCGGIIFQHENEIIKAFFQNPEAKLPVLLKTGEIGLFPWGRRKDQQGCLPEGGWARFESIKKGFWNCMFPIAAKVIVSEFLDTDRLTGVSNWYSIERDKYIQAIIARDNNEIRAYIVTIDNKISDVVSRYPRILNNPKGIM